MNLPNVPSRETGPEIRYGLDGLRKRVGRHWNKRNRRKSKRDPRRVKKNMKAIVRHVVLPLALALAVLYLFYALVILTS